MTEEKNVCSGFERLYKIIMTLRSENGCAWDREQTSKSLLPALIEESFELVDAVEQDDFPHIKEELGDLYLLVTMISYINIQEEHFSLEDVFTEISEKLIRRHPHVFTNDNKLNDPEKIITQWNKIKKEVEGRGNNGSITETIPLSIPPLERSFQIQKKVAKHGFDWENIEDVVGKFHEEVNEFEDELQSCDSFQLNQDRLEDEIGDVLFSLINIARHLQIDPSIALHRTNKKFLQRFTFIEKKMKEKNLEIESKNFEIMDNLWNEAKKIYQ